MLKFRLTAGIQILIIGALSLSACGAAEPELTPTLTIAPDAIRTQAVGTFAAGLTVTAAAAPTNTPTITPTPPATLALATSTGGVAFGSTAASGGTTSSCYGLAYVSDVTIPDNTEVKQGEKFTKTWKVKNAGTCAWDAGFKFTFVSGEEMDGETYTLPSSVAAGAVTDISVTMTAPNKKGTLRGDWRMSTAGGEFFGDQVYVQVVVGGGGASSGATATATQGSAATEAPTAQ